MMNAKILRLNKAGTPIDWITREEAATLVVKDQVFQQHFQPIHLPSSRMGQDALL